MENTWQPPIDSFTSYLPKSYPTIGGRSVDRSVGRLTLPSATAGVGCRYGGWRRNVGEGKVDGKRRELLEWSGKDGAESLRIFILYGRCFA